MIKETRGCKNAIGQIKIKTLQTNYNTFKMNWYKHIVRRRYNSETIFSGSRNRHLFGNNIILLSFPQPQRQKRNVLLNNTEHNVALIPVDKGLFRRQDRFQTICRIQFWMLITAFGHNCRIISVSLYIQPLTHNSPICLREALGNTEHNDIYLKQVHYKVLGYMQKLPERW